MRQNTAKLNGGGVTGRIKTIFSPALKTDRQPEYTDPVCSNSLQMAQSNNRLPPLLCFAAKLPFDESDDIFQTTQIFRRYFFVIYRDDEALLDEHD
jgi:hypothetical protein